MLNLPRVATLACLLLTACANYDFAAARLPDGSPDFPKLIQDLAASGQKELVDFTWIPLIYFDSTTFAASEYNYPEGYTLQDTNGFAPLFCAGAATTTVVDKQGGAIESEAWDWFGWGVLYYDLDQRIETPFGPRLGDRGRFALWHWDHPLYLTSQAKAKAEAAAKAAAPGSPVGSAP